MAGQKRQILIQTILIIVILILINVFGQNLYTYLDLTEDKRFTLEDATQNLLNDIDDHVLVDVLLDGSLSSGLKKLQDRTQEILHQLKSINPNIDFQFSNPSEGSVEEVNQRKEYLRREGIYPNTLFIVEDDKRVEKLIYPYAIINRGNRRIPVNLLEAMSRGESEEQSINRSMMLLEYKLTSALSKLFSEDRRTIAFTTGNGELSENQTATLEALLSQSRKTARINLDSTYQIKPEVDVLIVAKPLRTISQRSQFIIDQYIMNGGKVIWLIDQFHVNLDSINLNKVYVPKPIEHGLDDLFFKYGIRINKNVVLDLENSKIAQIYGVQGDRPQQQLFSWVYHPLLMPDPNSAMVKNIDRVASTYPSTIEYLANDKVKTTASTVLTSSEFSRYQVYPSIQLSFEILRIEQKPEAYNKKNLPVAILVEGEFESFFKNRVSDSMAKTLNEINVPFKEISPPTSQLFVSDGDIIKNLYDEKNNRISPIGFNKWEGIAYEGNKDFIINAIDYMLDDYGLIASRSKNFKIRLLNQNEVKNHKLKWQIINLALPVFLVLLSGLIFIYFKRKKYT